MAPFGRHPPAFLMPAPETIMSSRPIRNVGLVAHVDHGKTTLVDALLRSTGVVRAESTDERILDSGDLEREKGITILAKAASIEWNGIKINLVDTPGHADFGGEVERGLTLVDGVLLLVDAAEGPLPQTRYVLSKAMEQDLPVVVVLNKVDRKDARAPEVLDMIYELFIELDAEDHHIEFPVFSAIAREGRAIPGVGMPGPDDDLAPLLDAIVDTVPAPEGDPAGHLQALVTNLDASDYLGRLGVGRVFNGTLRADQPVAYIPAGGEPHRARLTALLGFTGLGRANVDAVEAGDLFVCAGIEDLMIGDTICTPEHPDALPRLTVDEPVLKMTFGPNTSPMSGSGTYLTARHIAERLHKEALGNVSIRLRPTHSPDILEVAGRGELQLAVLIETMRREGYELEVSRPEVITQVIDGVLHEPRERVTVDVPDDYVGAVSQIVAPRKGQVTSIEPGRSGRTIVVFVAPARGLLGFRTLLLTQTRGTALVFTQNDGWMPWVGELPHRSGGAMVADRPGRATSYALNNLQERGTLFVAPRDEVYEGMVVGENARPEDMSVNPTKEKQKTNMRASGSDEGIKLEPPRELGIETAIEFIADDELVEVTPSALRIRKRIRDRKDRERAKT